MAKADFKFHCTVRVRWAECDPQGIAFNGAYLVWMEIAQAEYWRHLGLRLYRLAELNVFDTAMVKLGMEFRAPARLDDLIQVHARISRLGTSSLTIAYEVYQVGNEELLASMDGVYVNYDGKAQRSRSIPDEIRRLVTHFEETGELLPLAQFPILAQGAATPSVGDSGQNA